MDIQITISELKVTEISSSSGIFSGETSHTQWSAMSKSNSGQILRGNGNCSDACFNMVYDPNHINMFKGPANLLTKVNKK